MTDIYLHNTLSGQKERFIPMDPDHVRVYVCGPTVYSYVHIGNGRPAVVFDTLTRLLRSAYPRVTYVSNITDIDDKINAAAAEGGESIKDLAARYTEAYLQDIQTLGVIPADVIPLATHHIQEIVSMINELIDAEFAYVSAGSRALSRPR